MKRPILLAGVFLTVGIVLGASCARGLSAQQSQTRFTELLRAELAGIEGKEAVIGIAEIAPGAKPGRHYHPGDEFFYLLEGSFTWAEDGKAPHVVNAGDLRHQPARRVAEAKDITAPVRYRDACQAFFHGRLSAATGVEMKGRRCLATV